MQGHGKELNCVTNVMETSGGFMVRSTFQNRNPLEGSVIEFRGVRELGWEKNMSQFLLSSN